MRKIPTLVLLSFIFSIFLSSCKTDPQKEENNWKNNDNTLRVRDAIAVKTLNPYLYRFKNESTIFSLIYQSLESFHPETQQIHPELAAQSPIVENIDQGEWAGGQSFTYEILPEAAWDDGKAITGRDVEFTLKSLFNPKMPFQRFWAYYDNVKNIEVDESNPNDLRRNRTGRAMVALSTRDSAVRRSSEKTSQFGKQQYQIQRIDCRNVERQD